MISAGSRAVAAPAKWFRAWCERIRRRGAACVRRHLDVWCHQNRGRTMMKTLKVCTAIAAMICMTGEAFAGSRCVRQEEMTALRVAAIQQQLMVAALSCNDISRYNKFVVSYRRELLASDDTLKRYFKRTTGGVAAYHAYKTRLANQSSLRSIGNGGYCREAEDAFDVALNSDSHS